jgi:hypothetical protein
MIGGLKMQEAEDKIKELQKNKNSEGERKQPQCFVCMDTGVILYKKMTPFGYEAEYAARCTCPSGNQYIYEGQECKDHKSKYRIATIDEVLDKYELAQNNFQQWIAKSREARVNEG